MKGWGAEDKMSNTLNAAEDETTGGDDVPVDFTR